MCYTKPSSRALFVVFPLLNFVYKKLSAEKLSQPWLWTFNISKVLLNLFKTHNWACKIENGHFFKIKKNNLTHTSSCLYQTFKSVSWTILGNYWFLKLFSQGCNFLPIFLTQFGSISECCWITRVWHPRRDVFQLFPTKFNGVCIEPNKVVSKIIDKSVSKLLFQH